VTPEAKVALVLSGSRGVLRAAAKREINL